MPEESATSDLVERVRAMFMAADRAESDTALNSYAEDAVWVMVNELRSFEGVDAIRAHWEEWYAAYEDFRFQALEVVDLGGGVVFAAARQGGRLGGSGSVLSQDIALVYEWSNDLVKRVEAHFDFDHARAAAERLAEERE